MTKQEQNLLLSYIHNMQLTLERELEQLTQNIRYRRFDSLDLVELLLLQERLQCFVCFARDVLYILNQKKYTNEKGNTL